MVVWDRLMCLGPLGSLAMTVARLVRPRSSIKLRLTSMEVRLQYCVWGEEKIRMGRFISKI